MIRLPVWELGLVILAPLAVAYLLRGQLERALVNSLPALKQPKAQFKLDLGLFFLCGATAAFTLLFHYRFPLQHSGLKLLLGIFTVGVFAGLDLALARERSIINAALKGTASYAMPGRFSPLTRTVSLSATLILLLITGVLLLILLRDVHWLSGQSPAFASITNLGQSVLIEIIFVMGFLTLMTVNLIFSYARNIRILFRNQTRALENVSQGDLTQRVPVITSDELGVIAGHTNGMIRALREGVRMREGLLIAQEVQQHFLPDTPPTIAGLDIAGLSRFSDETGGDFYDFIDCDDAACGQTTIAVGDVSGHGIGAGLLMAAGRAVIRQNAATASSPADSVSLANVHLTRDIGDTGRFMTLFYLTLNTATRQMIWVNAGHQPPQAYDPTNDSFSELKGEDIPLGVEEEWSFHEQTMTIPEPGHILLIGTDGIWEAHNETGDMFGSDRLQAVVRENRDKSADEILHAVCATVQNFTGLATQEDDVTLVVLKGVDG